MLVRGAVLPHISDLTFILGDRLFPVNKFLFAHYSEAIRSHPQFADLTEFAISKPYDPESFQDFCDACQHKPPRLTARNVPDLILLAQDFQCQEISDFLQSRIGQWPIESAITSLRVNLERGSDASAMEVHIAQKLEEALLSPAFSDLPLEVVSRIFARNGLQTLSDPRSLVTFVLKHEDENAGELLRSAPLGCVDRAVLEQLVVAKRVPSRIDGNVAFSLILQAAGELDRLKRELAELDAEVRRFQGVIGTARPVEAEQFSGARAALREAESEKERLAGRVKPMAEGESGAAVEESPTSLQQFVDDRRARVAELTREYRLLGRPDLNQGILRRLRRELRQNPIGTAVDAIVTPPEAVVPGHGCEHILDEGTFWARGTTEVNGFRLNFRESRVRVDGFALRTNTLGCDKLALPKSFSLRGSVNGSDWDVLFEVTEVNGFGWAEQLRKFQWVSHTDKWYQWIEYNQTDAVYPYTDRGQVVALADFDLFGDIRK